MKAFILILGLLVPASNGQPERVESFESIWLSEQDCVTKGFDATELGLLFLDCQPTFLADYIPPQD